MRTVLDIGFVAGGGADEPPHPATNNDRNMPTTTLTQRAFVAAAELFFHRRKRIGNTIAAKRGREGHNRAACLWSEIVSDVDADDPPVRVTFAGVKLQVVPAGRPEQLNDTVPARPHLEVTCRASGEEVAPLVTDRSAAESAIERSGSLA
jgi:hypothetical protein